jgi:PAS domain S-box-containing protein
MTSRTHPRWTYSWLVGIIVGMAAVVVLTFVIGLKYFEDHTVKSDGENLALIAMDIAEKFNLLIVGASGDIRLLGDTASRVTWDHKRWTAHLHAMKTAYPLYQAFAMIGPDGRVLAATDEAAVGRDVSGDTWFHDVSEDDTKIQVRDVGSSVLSQGIDAVSIAVPLRTDSSTGPRRFQGAVVGLLGVPMIEDVVTRTLRGRFMDETMHGDLEYQVMDQQGNLFIDSDLYHKGLVNLITIGQPSARLAQSGKSGYLEEEHLRRHVRVITGYSQLLGNTELSNLRWGVLVRVDRQAVLAPLRSVLWRVGLFGGSLVLSMLVLYLWVVGRLEETRISEQGTQAKLQESHLFLQSTLDALTSHIAILDEYATIVAVNGMWRQFAVDHQSSDPHHMVGKNYLQVCDSAAGPCSEEAKEVAKGIRALLQGVRTQCVFEYPCHSRDEQRWFMVRISSFDLDGVLRLVVAHDDITENKRSIQVIRQISETTRLVISNALDGHIMVDQQGIIVGWNMQAEHIFGWSPGEAMGRRVSETIVPPHMREIYERDFQLFLTTGTGSTLKKHIELDGWTRDGIACIVELSTTLIQYEGKFTFSIFVRDITARKQEEHRQTTQYTITRLLSDSNSLEEAAPYIMGTICQALHWNVGSLWKVEEETQVLRCAEAWNEKADFAPFIESTRQHSFAKGVGLPGRVWKNGTVEWIVDVGFDGNFPRLAVATAAGLHAAFAFPIFKGDQFYGVMEFFATVLREPDKKLLDLVEGLAGQITQYLNQKQAEATLRFSEARFAGILDIAEEAIISVDSMHQITLFNQGATKVFGYTPEEVLGQPLDMLLPSRFAHTHGHQIRKFEESPAPSRSMGSRKEVVGLRKNGEEFSAEASIAKVCVNAETTFTVILRDISIRKLAEENLRLTKNQAEQAAREKSQILATVDAFFIGVTDCLKVSEWTNRAEQLFGISWKDAIGKTLRELPIEWKWEELLAALNQTGDMMTTVRLEKVRLMTPGKRERVVKLTISPLCDDHGVGFVIMGEDVTARLNLEHDLVQAQKLESIGHLAAGIAHEINTPTQFVGDNVRFLSDSFSDIAAVLDRHHALMVSAKAGICAPDLIDACEAESRRADLGYLMEEIPKAIAQSTEGVTRIASIVRAMKEFAHPGSDEKACVDLNKAIESTVTVARNEWKYVADLTTDLAPCLPLVPCLLGQFNQVILNMIVNATHAIVDVTKGTGAKGTISITTRAVDGWAEVRIADSGAGIPEEIRRKIFDPFFTTKEVGKGTGQGLAIAHSVIVDKHHGTITLESEVGRGSTFIVRLPLSVQATTVETEMAA